MRHFWSLLLGLALAPILWGATAWSTYRFIQVSAENNPIKDAGAGLIVPSLLLAVTGLFVGLLLGTQLSPLAPGIVGTAFLVIAAIFIFSPKTMLDIAATFSGDHAQILSVPAGLGSAILLGVASLVPLASPSRWRRSDNVHAAGTVVTETQETNPDLADDRQPCDAELMDGHTALPRRQTLDIDEPVSEGPRARQLARIRSVPTPRGGERIVLPAPRRIEQTDEDEDPMWTPRRLRDADAKPQRGMADRRNRHRG